MEVRAKYVLEHVKIGLGRNCRYSLLHRVKLEGLADIVDSSCDVQSKDEAREVFFCQKTRQGKKGFTFLFHFENVSFFGYLYVSVSMFHK